jgi:hypothetical protein
VTGHESSVPHVQRNQAVRRGFSPLPTQAPGTGPPRWPGLLDRSYRLTPDEVLAEIRLVPRSGSAGNPRVPSARQLSVQCGRPLVYPASADDLPSLVRQRRQSGTSHHGMLLSFDLQHLPPGHCYTAVRFAVSLADNRFAAVGLECDVALPPNSAFQVAQSRASWLQRLWLTATTRATVSGMHSSRFGWSYDAPGGALNLHCYTMHALLEAPPDLVEVAGVLSVEAEILRKSRDHPRSPVVVGQGAVDFTEPLVNEREQDQPTRLFALVGARSQQRASRGAARQAQRRTAIILERALDQTSVNESHIDFGHEGHHWLIALPAESDHPTVIKAFIRGLRIALREVNADPGALHIRLLVGLDQGVVKPGAAFEGRGPLAWSIVESSAMDDSPLADLVVVVSDGLYRNVLEHARGELNPDSFHRLSTGATGGNAPESAWLCVPEAP